MRRLVVKIDLTIFGLARPRKSSLFSFSDTSLTSQTGVDWSGVFSTGPLSCYASLNARARVSSRSVMRHLSKSWWLACCTNRSSSSLHLNSSALLHWLARVTGPNNDAIGGCCVLIGSISPKVPASHCLQVSNFSSRTQQAQHSWALLMTWHHLLSFVEISWRTSHQS